MEKGIVYKYPLPIGKITTIELPETAKFLSVKNRLNEVVAYFMLDAEPNEESTAKETYKFLPIETGQVFDVEMGMSYVDSLVLYNGDYVIHIFESN